MSKPTHDHLFPTAKSVLGVPGDASLSDCKQAFLWRLEEEGCNPSPDLVEAASLLGVIDGKAASYSLLQNRFENKLNQSLDDFIGDYWNLNPANRRAEWERLSGISETLPRQGKRISDLNHGLNLEIPTDDDRVFEPVILCLNRAYLAPTTIRRQVVITIAEEQDLSLEKLNALVTVFKNQHPEFSGVLDFLEFGKNVAGVTPRDKSDKRSSKHKPIDYLGNAISRLEKKHDRKSFMVAILLVIIISVLRITYSKDSNEPVVVPKPTYPKIEFNRLTKETDLMFPKLETKSMPKSYAIEMLLPNSIFKGSMPKTDPQTQPKTNDP